MPAESVGVPQFLQNLAPGESLAPQIIQKLFILSPCPKRQPFPANAPISFCPRLGRTRFNKYIIAEGYAFCPQFFYTVLRLETRGSKWYNIQNAEALWLTKRDLRPPAQGLSCEKRRVAA